MKNLNNEKINMACNKIYFAMTQSKNDPKATDIYFYDEIQKDGKNFLTGEDVKSETSVKTLKNELDKLENISTLNIHINSQGGSVFEGIAIYSLLKQNKAYKKVYIDGVAASIASVIAMSGNEVIMSDSSMMMIHPAWTIALGNAEDLRKEADTLDKLTESIKQAYLGRVNIDEETLNELITDETWLSAKECVEYGFADKILGKSVENGDDKPKTEENKNDDFTEKALSIIGGFFM